MKANGRTDRKGSEDELRETEERSHGKVPLYLIPQAVSKAIKEEGGTIQSIHVTRSAGHNYNVTVSTQAGGRTAEKSGAKDP